MVNTIIEWISKISFLSRIAPYLENKIISSFLILFVFIILARLTLTIFNRLLVELSSKEKDHFDDFFIAYTKRPLFLLTLVYGLKLSLLNYGTLEIVIKLVDSLVMVLFLWLILRLILVIIDSWGKSFAKRKKTRVDDTVLPLFHKGAAILFFIIALMLVLNLWNVNLTPYLAGVGISGIVLGMALQDSLKNIFGGIALIMDKNFSVGDKIKLESGQLGEVYGISLRSTRIKTYDNEVIIIPNGILANSKIQNYTEPNSKVRVGVELGIEYGSDINKAREIIIKTIKKMKNILKDPKPEVQFLEMGNYSLNIKALFWVENWNDGYYKKLEATEEIYNALKKSKINIAFPTQTIFLNKNKK